MWCGIKSSTYSFLYGFKKMSICPLNARAIIISYNIFLLVLFLLATNIYFNIQLYIIIINYDSNLKRQS